MYLKVTFEMRLLGLLIFAVLINCVVADIPLCYSGRCTMPWITFKECLIMKSPIAMLHGLIQEYGRRTEDPSIIRSLNQLQTMYMETLTSSITDETSWLEAATFTRTMLKEVNDRLQKLYNENPGAWNQQFPDMDGFYKENVEKRLKEVYDTLGECYKALTPCDFSDVKCHWRWIVLGELSQ